MPRLRRRQGRRGLLIACTLVSLHTAGALPRTASANLVWEDYFADGQAVLDGTSVIASTGTIVTFSRNEYSDFDSGTFDLTPGGNDDFVTFESGQLGGQHNYLELSLDNESNDPADYVEFSLNFDRAITDLQFSLLDVDGNQNWDDAVEIYYNGTINARDNPSIVALTGPYNMLDQHPYMHGWESNGQNAGNGQTDGNIDFDFGSLTITSLTIRFFSTDDPRSDPIAQQIGISDLTFVEAVPEASSLAYMGLFGAIVLIVHGRRRRDHLPAKVELRVVTCNDGELMTVEAPPNGDDVGPEERWVFSFPAAAAQHARHNQAA